MLNLNEKVGGWATMVGNQTECLECVKHKKGGTGDFLLASGGLSLMSVLKEDVKCVFNSVLILPPGC